MTDKDLAKRWDDSADDNWRTAQILFDNKQYSDCLFFGHLTLEKALKARILRVTDTLPPVSHNLVLLARTAGLTLGKTQEQDLAEITTFNIDARYDIIKLSPIKKPRSNLRACIVTK